MIEAKQSVHYLHRHKDIGADRKGEHLLDKNERTIPYASHIIDGVMNSVTPDDISRYPDQSSLYQKLASHLGVDISHLLLTSGSDSGLKLIFDAFIQKHDEIVYLQPTYGMVPVYIEMFGARGCPVLYDKNLGLDRDQIINAVKSDTKLVIIVNPNQPTGTVLELDFLKTLAQHAEQYNTLCIVDEAYIEFSDNESAISLVNDYSNLGISRTFSKAWGLAGVRLGYIVSNNNVINELMKVKSLLDINVFAIKAAEYFIENYKHVVEHASNVKMSRDYAFRRLKAKGFLCVNGYGNFLHVGIPTGFHRSAILSELQDRGYRVRLNENTGTVLDTCLRFTVGDKAQVSSFLDVLIDLFENRKC